MWPLGCEKEQENGGDLREGEERLFQQLLDCPRIWGKLNTGVLGDTRTHTEFENLELPFLMLIRITMHSLYVHSYLALKF